MLLSLTAALTIASVVTLLLLPRVLQGNLMTEAISPLIIPLCLWSFVPVLIVGHACMFLTRVAAYAAAGEVKYVGWPSLDPWPPLAILGRWTVCFLCGPVLAAWACLYYWLHAGVMGPLDWIIVAELLIPAAGLWLIAVLLTSQSDRLADASPLRVFAAIGWLRGRALAAAAIAIALFFIHLLLGTVAIEHLHRDPISGTLLIGLCWLSALYSAAFLLRLLGLWYHRALRQQALETTPVWAIPGLSFAPATISR